MKYELCDAASQGSQGVTVRIYSGKIFSGEFLQDVYSLPLLQGTP